MLELVFTPFPFLYTERFVLRQIEMRDAGEIFALRSDDRVNEFLDRPKAKTIDDARKHIQRLEAGVNDNQSIAWAITLRDTDTLIGSVCLWNMDPELSKAEIGYELLPAFQGQGVMGEVLPVIIDYGFEKIRLECIEAELSPKNLKSIKLLEKNKFILQTSNPDTSDSILYKLNV